MKKILIGVMGLMFIATPIYAQSVPTDTPTVEDQYIQALQTVIGLLQQQVALLVEQLQKISDNQVAITASQTALTTQVSEIAQNTALAPSAPVFAGISTSIDCTPVLEGQNIRQAGNLDTGIDSMFIGTTTIPNGCNIKDLQNNLQTNQVLYHSPVWAWKNNGDIHYTDTGFIFRQGWNVSKDSGGVNGNIIWYVGSSTLAVPYDYSNN